MLKTITADAILDYQVCELFYQKRYLENYVEGPKTDVTVMWEKFEKTLIQTANYYFHRRQAGDNVSYKRLLARWEKLWFPKEMNAYDLALQRHLISHPSIISHSNAAVAALENFYDFFLEIQDEPTSISEDYLVPLAGGALTGTFDLILRKGDEYTVVTWLARSHKPKPDFYARAALRYAYEMVYPGRKVTYKVFNLATLLGGWVDVEQPKSADIDALKYWANEAFTSTEFIPRRGYTAYCSGCPFDDPCRKWQQWPDPDGDTDD